MSYQPPVNAMQFLLRHGVDIDKIIAQPEFSQTNDELIGDILNGAGLLARDIISPTNQAGDATPAQLKGQDVTAPPGFKEAYQAFVEGGWQSLAMPEAIGGLGLPSCVAVATNEMIYGSNMAFGLCPMLTGSATLAVHAHASEALKKIYLDKMVSGEWSGAMDLTEPQAGSDLGPVRTKAVDNGDGTYAITGQKIFITWGDHDLAENIIHLVLARLPDSPEGSRGISLFLCPKYLVNDDGSLGERNDFSAISLEHKLGIHGSPTCVMDFNGAKGWLVGEVNRGLPAMFTMMNEARLFVGVQGVAIGERAYQAALIYANERVQGTPPGQESGAPIVGHPDVRRMLIDMKARLMGARAIAMVTAASGDLGNHRLASLLTPISKSYGSDLGVEVASIGVQVHGGMGFVEETGVAQHLRDSRIAPIYEGTNGIQAMDLVGRKLRRDGGVTMRALISDLSATAALAATQSGQAGLDVQPCIQALETGIAALSEATDIVLDAEEMDALSVAAPYLTLCASVISGGFLLKAVINGMAAGDALTDNMAALTRYHAVSVLPQAQAQLDFIRFGARSVFDFPELQLADL